MTVYGVWVKPLCNDYRIRKINGVRGWILLQLEACSRRQTKPQVDANGVQQDPNSFGVQTTSGDTAAYVVLSPHDV